MCMCECFVCILVDLLVVLISTTITTGAATTAIVVAVSTVVPAPSVAASAHMVSMSISSSTSSHTGTTTSTTLHRHGFHTGIERVLHRPVVPNGNGRPIPGRGEGGLERLAVLVVHLGQLGHAAGTLQKFHQRLDGHPIALDGDADGGHGGVYGEVPDGATLDRFSACHHSPSTSECSS